MIRHKFLTFHRINGYVTITFLLIGTISAFTIARHSFGGTLETQAGVGVVGIAVIGGVVMAYINVKRLQIDQHRAWMLRTWFYAGSIITMRFIMLISMAIISSIQGYFFVEPCSKIDYILGGGSETVLRLYPSCAAFYDGTNPDAQAVVQASMTSGNIVEVVAAMNVTFGMALWLALVLNAVGVEIYVSPCLFADRHVCVANVACLQLHLTPKEATRLLNVSHEKQLEARLRGRGDATSLTEASRENGAIRRCKQVGKGESL